MYGRGISEGERNALRKNAALSIANQYLHGTEEAQPVARRLSSKGSFGNLLAGEILVEQASRQTPSMAPDWFRHARALLEKATYPTKDESPDLSASSIARAEFRLAQLSALEEMFSKGVLPKNSTTQRMYNELTKRAISIADTSRSMRGNQVHSAMQLRGFIGELAVLLIAQRYSIQQIGSDSWLPFQSFFSENNGGDCLYDTGAPTWDINIYTQTNKSDPIEKSYMLQVKSAKPDSDIDPAIPIVSVNSDLFLPGDDGWLGRVGDKIIRSCSFELERPEASERLTRELDIRTEMLLEIIG